MHACCDISEFVDTDAYPVLENAAGAQSACVKRVQRQLTETACSVLPGFVRPFRLERLAAEGRAVAFLAHVNTETVNVYNIPGRPGSARATSRPDSAGTR
jgi:hypothetical protein